MFKNSAEHNINYKNLTWDEYIRRGEFPLDHKKYLDASGNLMVDKIIKYEDINHSMQDIARLLGFNFSQLTATAKTGFRISGLDVSLKDRQKIYKAFKPSLKFTDYLL